MDGLQRPGRARTVRADGGDRSVDDLNEALADTRRRIVVSALVAADGPVPLADIADRLVEEERGESNDEDEAVVPRSSLGDAQALLNPPTAPVDLYNRLGEVRSV